MNAMRRLSEEINGSFCITSLTSLISSIHGLYFSIAPGDQDLNQSMFISPCTLT